MIAAAVAVGNALNVTCLFLFHERQTFSSRNGNPAVDGGEVALFNPQGAQATVAVQILICNGACLVLRQL